MCGRGHAMAGGEHGRGLCMVGGACVVGGHVWQRVHGRGAYMVGGCVAEGHVWQGVCMAGGMQWQEEHVWQGKRGMHGRRDGHCSRRYTSYCNTFLFVYKFT